MRVLYVALRNDYGIPENGYSFEHYNFFDCLHRMGHDVIYFDPFVLNQRHGKEKANRRLIEVAKSEKPDLMFTVLFTDELDPKAVQYISEETDVATFNWFCDDHYRFDTFSSVWAPVFNWVATTDEATLPKYEAIGYHNVILTQWACNHFLYRKLDLPMRWDATFIGRPHGSRKEMIAALRAAGIQVHVWGTGWESGRLSQDEMLEVFNSSRINLNYSNSPFPIMKRPSVLQRVRSKVSRTVRELLAKPVKVEQEYQTQIKGRVFEIPGCGGFMMTSPAEKLDRYYSPGHEISVFRNPAEMVKQAKFFLANEGKRTEIARAGYERTAREHTYVHRFREIFRVMGLVGSEGALDGNLTPGALMEVS